MAKKTFTVSIMFEETSASNVLEAAKDIAQFLKEGSYNITYEVTDEETGEEFTVDLAEEDEDAVLPAPVEQDSKDRLYQALENSTLQLEYLNEKFGEVGSTNSTIARNTVLLELYR